jgi:hypothetical protein
MEVKVNLRTIFGVLLTLALILGFILLVLKPFTNRARVTDWKGVAACQKTVQDTYSSLSSEASVVAPGTTSGIQKEEQSAENNCVASNTH